jgi:hypothetical protein
MAIVEELGYEYLQNVMKLNGDQNFKWATKNDYNALEGKRKGGHAYKWSNHTPPKFYTQITYS